MTRIPLDPTATREWLKDSSTLLMQIIGDLPKRPSQTDVVGHSSSENGPDGNGEKPAFGRKR